MIAENYHFLFMIPYTNRRAGIYPRRAVTIFERYYCSRSGKCMMKM